MPSKQFTTVDNYIQTFPENVQIILQNIRQIVREKAPEAVETISYDIPSFKLNGKYLVHFAAWKKHIALYPIPEGNKAFAKELSPYIAGKGTIQFLLEKPIPYELIKKLVAARVKKNEESGV